ncbi:SDR family oxidoreductase [Hwanghaeella sp.]|uniref:SDR family oxidoreductase n=1 Tax=Hwanghaeella sp. TaxID=2605943 RepID=UPI003CCBD471
MEHGCGRLSGKRIFVTGAGQGIGLASALAMIREGAAVVATDKDPVSVERLRGVEGVIGEVMDVTDSRRVQEVAEAVGPVDALFNCAGYVSEGTILDCSEEEWDRTQDINGTGTYRVIKAFLPGMLARGTGSIVNMSSMASTVKGVPNRFAYSASKAAILGITKAIAIDFIRDGIRCNAVCPGIVDSPSLRERLSRMGDAEKAMEAFAARQPMGQLGMPEDIAPLIVYLVSDESAFVTGCMYSIDGGISL